METSNQKKARLLGEPFGTANNRLRKMLLFECVKLLGLDKCYRCGDPIESIAEFSVEHTSAWMSAQNPREAFYDLTKISYSHLVCNINAEKVSKYGSADEKWKAAHQRIKNNPQAYSKKLERKRKQARFV